MTLTSAGRVDSTLEPRSRPHLLDEPIHPAPTRNAFELMLTRILKRKSRAVEECHCGFGDEYLTRLSQRGNACGDMHGYASEVSSLALDFTRVNTGPNAEVIQSGD
jgi:hypothetical protein